MTYWLVSPPTPLMSIPWQVITLSAACGLVIDTLLVVNNYRDIDNDRRAGKRTLIVRIGEHGGLTLYAILGFISTILALIGMAFLNWQDEQYAKLIILLYLPFHIVTFTEMRRIRKGAELNKVLGMTARNMLIYGILVTIGLLV